MYYDFLIIRHIPLITIPVTHQHYHNSDSRVVSVTDTTRESEVVYTLIQMW